MATKQEDLLDTLSMAKHRGNIYGFLAMIFRKEVTLDFLRRVKESEMLSGLMEMGAAFDDDFLHCPDSQLVEDLAVEYTRLFIGPGPHLSPHESVYHERSDGDWGTLWGADTVAVKKFLESTGLHYKTEFKDMPDHIGVEFEFMMSLAEREAWAWGKKDREGAEYCRKIEWMFVRDHISKWVPLFCDKVVEHAKRSFYREIARITKNFIETEKDHLKSSLY